MNKGKKKDFLDLTPIEFEPEAIEFTPEPIDFDPMDNLRKGRATKD